MYILFCVLCMIGVVFGISEKFWKENGIPKGKVRIICLIALIIISPIFVPILIGIKLVEND